MKILSFDLAAYKFGFAIGESDTKSIIRCGKVEVSIDRAAGITEESDRAFRLMQRAFKLIKDQQPALILCEDTRISFGNNLGLQDYYTKGNLRYLEIYCAVQKLPFDWVAIQGWKGVLFGRGYKKIFKELAKEQGKKKVDIKKEAIKKIKSLYPDLKVDDDDAAEATALIHSVFSK